MIKRAVAIAILPCLSMFSFAGAAFAADPMPGPLRDYATKLQGTLNEMVVSDPGMMKEAGLTAEQVKGSQLKFGDSFHLHRIDGPQAESAKELSQAVNPTGVYYVPYCVDGKCPLVAAFTLDKTTREPAFVSVGQPKFTERVREAEAQLRGEPELNASQRRVVEFPEAHASFHLVRRADNGEEVLVPHSHDEAQQLLQMVKNPAEVLGTRTKTRGLYLFKPQHLAEISTYLKEHQTVEPGPSGTEHLGEPNKPRNPGPLRAKMSHASPARQGGGAVLELEPPTTAAPAPALDMPTSVEDVTPTVDESEEASTNVPTFGILALLSVGSICGLGACMLKKAKA